MDDGVGTRLRHRRMNTPPNPETRGPPACVANAEREMDDLEVRIRACGSVSSRVELVSELEKARDFVADVQGELAMQSASRNSKRGQKEPNGVFAT